MCHPAGTSDGSPERETQYKDHIMYAVFIPKLMSCIPVALTCAFMP